MIKDLAESLGYTAHGLTITKLAELAEEPYSARFKSLCSDLLPLAKTIQGVNAANKALLRHSVELVRSSLAFFNNLIAANPFITDQAGCNKMIKAERSFAAAYSLNSAPGYLFHSLTCHQPNNNPPPFLTSKN